MIVQELFFSSLSEIMAYIKSTFGGISSAITMLDAVNLDIKDSLEIVWDAKPNTG